MEGNRLLVVGVWILFTFIYSFGAEGPHRGNPLTTLIPKTNTTRISRSDNEAYATNILISGFSQCLESK